MDPKKLVYFIGDNQVYVSGEGQDSELDTILVNSFANRKSRGTQWQCSLASRLNETQAQKPSAGVSNSG